MIGQFNRARGELEFPNYCAQGMKTLVRNNDRFERPHIHRPALHLEGGDVALAGWAEIQVGFPPGPDFPGYDLWSA